MFKRLKDLLFQNRSTKQTIIKNTIWLTISQIGSRLIRAIIVIYSARVMGAAEYGVYSYALSLAGFFTVFADIGINAIVTRELVQKPDQKQEYFSTAFWLKIIMLAITSALVVFVAPYFSKIEGAKIIIPLVALITVFDGLREFTLSSFRAMEKMEYEALVNTLTNVAITAFGFIAINISATAKSLAISYVFSVVAGFIAGAIIIRKNFLKIFSHFRKNLFKPIFSAAYPIAILGILGVFMLNTDAVMLGWWRTSTEIGYYSAGQKIVQILYTLPAILATSLFPVFSRLIGNKEYEKEKSLLENSMAILFAAAIPMVVGGIILANPIIKLIYGAQYLPAVFSFQILLLTMLLIFPHTIIVNLILAHNAQSKLKMAFVLGSVGNIAFNAILIPRFGIEGASFATVLAQIAYVSLTWKVSKKITNFSTLIHLKKIAAAGAIMGFFCLLAEKLGLNIIINIIASAIIYYIMLNLLKEKITGEFTSLFKKF